MEESLSSDYSSKNSMCSREYSGTLKQKNGQENDKLFPISKIISEILTDICEQGKPNIESKQLKPFISRKIPTISIKDYIDRLLKYSKTFKEIVIIILIYIDTICAKHKINLNYYNIHKFILAAFIVAIKFYEDEYYSISYYAKLGGISKKEAISLEYEFMSLMDFKLFVNQKLYDKYFNYLSNLEESDDDIYDEYDIVEVN
jgi:hypothetical protein